MKDSTFRIYWTSIIPQAAKILGRLWYKVHNNRRRIAVDNLMLAMKFPKEKAEKVALANFIHLARVSLEFPLLPHCNKMTTDLNALFEAIVRKDPIQWYWIHRRFRHSIEFTNFHRFP